MSFKILHICDTHIRHFGRLFYSTGRKLQNGFIKNNINCLNLSDRDITKLNKSLFDITGKRALLLAIEENIKSFKPDVIIIGHVDKLNYEDFVNLKEKNPRIIFCQWFLDPLIKDGGPDYLKNRDRFLNKYQICDFNFITTDPTQLDFVDEKKTFFIPNPIDPTIDCYNIFEKKKFEKDLFIAISHGQHRGILKAGYEDDRIQTINKIDKKIDINLFGAYNKNPVWGTDYFNELSKCKMALNITRGKPIKYYSSDRIASLLGNGILTFIHDGYSYDDFMTKDEIIFYSNIEDLNEKLNFYSKNDNERIRISKNGKIKSSEIFDNKLITNFMVSKIMNKPIEKKYKWMK
jgi:hypothetical protein